MKSTTSNQTFDIIVIGAGPAGLALGHALKKQDVNRFCILEKGPTGGTSWQNMPPWLQLITYWRENFLRPEDKKRFHINAQVHSQDFAAYLKELAKDLPMQFTTQVQEIKKTNDGFLLSTSQGLFSARNIVVATGYYSFPQHPLSFNTLKSEIPVIHFAELKSYVFEKKKKYLIVGRALSAGQVAEQIARAGGSFDFATRGPIQFGAGPKVLHFFLRHLTLFEALAKRTSPRRSSKVPMEGSIRKIIAASGAQTKPVPEKVEGRRVYFADQSSAEYDEVILATGFDGFSFDFLKSLYSSSDALQKDLSTLKEGLESTANPGLFYLGVDNQVDFTSRFLRGIRRDAIVLARFLQMKKIAPK